MFAIQNHLISCRRLPFSDCFLLLTWFIQNFWMHHWPSSVASKLFCIKPWFNFWSVSYHIFWLWDITFTHLYVGHAKCQQSSQWGVISMNLLELSGHSYCHTPFDWLDLLIDWVCHFHFSCPLCVSAILTLFFLLFHSCTFNSDSLRFLTWYWLIILNPIASSPSCFVLPHNLCLFTCIVSSPSLLMCSA